jgi:SAM-dependent methyltransferase
MWSADNGLAMMRQHGISVTDQDFFLDKKLPYESDYFDVVTVLDVIEHLPANPLALLSEIKRVLKPGGKVILGVPNAIGLAKFYKLIAGHHPYMGFDLWLKDQYFSHYREYSGKECEKMLAMTGFESSTIMSNEPLQTMTKNRYLDSKMSVISPGYLSLYMLYLGGKILKNRRPTIYCLGIKPE